MTDIRTVDEELVGRLRERIAEFERDVENELAAEGERADLWTQEIDVPIADIREAATRIEQLHKEVERLRKSVNFDEPDAFEAWWQGYRYKNRDLANYTIKKQIAFDAFHEALEQARAALTGEPSLPPHKEVETAFKDGFVSGFDHRGRTDDPDEAVAGAEREWAVRALTGVPSLPGGLS